MELSSVVVADDHPVYLKALEQVVTEDPALVLAGSATDGAEAMSLITSVRPDVAVLDVEMPRLSGPAVAARIARLEVPTRVLFLSAHRDGATVYDALAAAGGYGYVAKDATMLEIRQAILKVASGLRALGGGVSDPLIAGIQVKAESRTLALTDREEQVLALAVQGLTVAAMGKAMHLSSATIKVHLSTLYAKLGVGDRASAVAEAIRRGLID
jgi:two-component system, NarL family, nitrate/nitrite response regulator NarL